MKIELDARFKKTTKGRFGKYQFEVGVLQNRIHKQPLPKSRGLKSFHGGPARKVSNKPQLTIADVSKWNRKKKNYLKAPFKRRTSDIIKFAKEFFRLCAGKTEAKRAVNYLQAIVRNPMLRGDYGPNKRRTIRAKGFNRYMIDTGQLFTNIRARVITKRV